MPIGHLISIGHLNLEIDFPADTRRISVASRNHEQVPQTLADPYYETLRYIGALRKLGVEWY